MDPILGTIIIFAGNFAPKGWAFCQGQLLSVQQNTALFSLLGTTYGGNGVQTFALPDLRGRVAVSQGQGPGLGSYTLGQQGGTENVTLTSAQMPMHNHNIQANDATAPSTTSPSNAFFGIPHTGTGPGLQQIPTYATTLQTPAVMNTTSLSNAGQSQAHTNLQPFLAINYIIALQGIYPSRN